MAEQGNALSDALFKRMMAVVRKVEARGDAPAEPVRRQRREATSPPIRFGTPAAEFTSGATIELIQANADGVALADRDNVTVHLTAGAAAVRSAHSTSDVLRWHPYLRPDTNGVAGVLVGMWAFPDVPNDANTYVWMFDPVDGYHWHEAVEGVCPELE